MGCREERGSLIKKVLFLSLLDSLRSSPLSPEIAGKEIKAINFASGYNKKSGEKRGSTYTTEWPMCSLRRKIVASPSAPQKQHYYKFVAKWFWFPKEGEAKKKKIVRSNIHLRNKKFYVRYVKTENGRIQFPTCISCTVRTDRSTLPKSCFFRRIRSFEFPSLQIYIRRIPYIYAKGKVARI